MRGSVRIQRIAPRPDRFKGTGGDERHDSLAARLEGAGQRRAEFGGIAGGIAQQEPGSDFRRCCRRRARRRARPRNHQVGAAVRRRQIAHHLDHFEAAAHQHIAPLRGG